MIAAEADGVYRINSSGDDRHRGRMSVLPVFPPDVVEAQKGALCDRPHGGFIQQGIAAAGE
jgi:hypothetical protein